MNQRRYNIQNLNPFLPGNKFGKGGIKGSLNRKTILTFWFKTFQEFDKRCEQENRDRRNARRRELYKLNNERKPRKSVNE